MLVIWTTKKAPSTTDVFRAATLLWGVSRDDLLSNNRDDRLVKQRWIVFSLLAGRGMTHVHIGELFNRHPSTATYGIQQHLAQTDADYIENSDALVELHDQLIHGFDPHPSTSDGCYRDYPNAIIGRRHCPNMGGFSDYDHMNQTFLI